MISFEVIEMTWRVRLGRVLKPHWVPRRLVTMSDRDVNDDGSLDDTRVERVDDSLVR